MFRKLTPEEKEKYEQIAKKDKLRYKQEMDDYQASKKGGNNSDEESDADEKADSDSEGLNDEVDHGDSDDDDDDE